MVHVSCGIWCVIPIANLTFHLNISNKLITFEYYECSWDAR